VVTYDEFRVRLERGTGKRTYRVLATGPSGEASGTFRLPFTDDQLETRQERDLMGDRPGRNLDPNWR
jgi:hypothetical protein